MKYLHNEVIGEGISDFEASGLNKTGRLNPPAAWFTSKVLGRSRIGVTELAAEKQK
jgi:hypothetical protein